MLVNHAVEIAVPFAEASKLLLANPDHWLPGAASGAQRREGELLTDVGFEVAHLRVDKRVVIEILSLVRSQSSVVLLIRWEAHRGARLFPVFEGSLELTPIEGSRSRLFVSGEYEPPGGEIGRFGDAALLHHLATATISDFTERIAALVSNPIQSQEAST